jgi:chromosome partitioning protein
VSRRIAIGNHKGGSGKTSTTIGLAAALAEDGYDVLVVDLDPQANATRRLGLTTKHVITQLTIAEVIKASTPGVDGAAREAITTCGWGRPYHDHIDLIPSRFDLENRISEAATVGAVGRLRRALHNVDVAYDYTLIDLPPSLGHLTQLGLAAAQWAIASIEAEYDSVEGGARFREFIAASAADLGNPSLSLLGVIVGRLRTQLGAHAFQLAGLEDYFPGQVWEPYIPERAVIKDAGDSGEPIRAVGGVRASDTASIYGDLARLVIKETGE